jgi:ERCC4-type nuclease
MAKSSSSEQAVGTAALRPALTAAIVQGRLYVIARANATVTARALHAAL